MVRLGHRQVALLKAAGEDRLHMSHSHQGVMGVSVEPTSIADYSWFPTESQVDRLADLGLVEYHEDTRPRRFDSVVVRLTAKGREEFFRRMLGEPMPASTPKDVSP